MRFAYADPPYIGTARRYYRNHPDYAGEVDHRALLQRLYNEFPDGWALSMNVVSLWTLIPLIPKSWACRIGVWCKPFSPLGCRGRPRWAWEPLIWRGGRQREVNSLPPLDWLISHAQIAAIGHKGGNKKGDRPSFRGAKPDEFCYWLFELLNMWPEDEFIDLFPGTGRVSRAWEIWKKAKVALFVR